MINLRYKRKKTDDIESVEQLTEIEYQVLMGSILGDAHITKGGSYFEKHCEVQKEYSLWKQNILNRFNPIYSEVNNTVKGKQYKQSIITTKQYSVLKILRKEFYQTNKKGFLPINILKNMDAFGMMIWYFDDGSNSKGAFQIAAEEFTNNNAEFFVDLLNKKLGLDLHITKNGAVYINVKSQKILLPIWEGLFKTYGLPECMRYKIVRSNEYADYCKWTNEEMNILKDNYSKFSLEELKDKFFPTFSLNRIFEKGKCLKLKSFVRCKLDDDKKFITENYLKDRSFLRKVLPTRNDRRRIHERMRRMGLLKERFETVGKQPYNTWTETEEKILKDNYLLRNSKLYKLFPNKGNDCVLAKLQRTGLWDKRNKELNIIPKTSFNTWTETEEKILKDNYLLNWKDLYALFPNKKEDCIVKKMNRIGLYKIRLEKQRRLI